MIKKIIFLCSSLILLTACANPASGPRQEPQEGQPTPIPTPIVPDKPIYEVQRGDVRELLTFSARVSPIQEEAMIFAVDGKISEVYFTRGDTVQAGDVIAELNTAELETQLIQARAQLESAEIRLETTLSQLEIDRRRAEIALEKLELQLDYLEYISFGNPNPQQELEIRSLELEIELAELTLSSLDNNVTPLLQADVDTAKLNIETLEKKVEESRLLAPISGEILSLTFSEGENVSAFSSAGIIANVSAYEISALLQAQIMDQLTEGMTVSFTFSDRPSETYNGVIRQLPYPYGSGPDDDDSVHINFDETAAGEMSIGDRVSIEIVIEESLGTLWVSPGALRSFNSRYFVVIQSEDGQQRIDVSIGLESEARVEILDGLEEGQVIIGP
jgi:multidrug efflux pump subunit AcrA (membrane-fusion protein)